MPLNAYFRINANNSGQFERTLIIADEGADVTYIEGCFTAGTEVTTENGIKPIEQIRVGEKVRTHTGAYRSVYHTQVRPHTGKLFTISYFGDTSLELNATDEHPFLVSKREVLEYKNKCWATEWARADDLKVGDYLGIPIDRSVASLDERTFSIKMQTRWHLDEKQLKLQTDKDFFRLVGYYLSEGSMMGQKGDSYLTFTFNEDEKQYVDDVVSLVERYFGKKPYVQKAYKHGISIVLCSTIAARFFKNEFGKGAGLKTIPQWVIHESTEKQSELIKGMWRGDGSFMNKHYPNSSKRMFRINTISRSLAKNLRDILLRLNIVASINMQKRTGNRKNMYCVYIGAENINAFSAVVGFPIYEEVRNGNGAMLMEVKEIQTTSSHEQIVGNYAFVPIKKITFKEVESVPVYNFSVEDEESYVAGGVAVHNCTSPVYSSNSLHSAIVELVAMKGEAYTLCHNSELVKEYLQSCHTARPCSRKCPRRVD